MVITSIVQCIKVTKEGNINGGEMYVDLGEDVKITDYKNNEFVGRVLSMESNDEVDKVCLLLGNGKRYAIDVNCIEDIKRL